MTTNKSSHVKQSRSPVKGRRQRSFEIRMPDYVHAQLKTAAASAGVSMSLFIVLSAVAASEKYQRQKGSHD